MKKSTKSDTTGNRIAVIGSGLAGLTMTALLAAYGVDVVCFDKRGLKDQLDSGFDGRTTAISWGSRQIFKLIGVWQEMADQASPINTIHILDGDSPVLLDFNSEEVGGRTFGWIVENRTLRQVLSRYIEKSEAGAVEAPVTITGLDHATDHVSLHFAGRKTLTASLVIGADGRQSFTRESLGITSRQWSYRQRALVFNVVHEQPHNHIAVEHFMPDGPFAILPMTDTGGGEHRSSVVWTEHGNDRDSALHYDDRIFNAALNTRFPDRYGQVHVTGERFAYPLGLNHAHHYIGPRTVLIGDAAHGIHPIAGQGLNLGFRDIGALADLVVAAIRDGRDPGAQALLEKYQRRRRLDNIAMAGATDMLNRLFSNNIPPVRAARQVGLRLVSRVPFAKQFFMKQAMGAAGILPALIREQEAA